MHELQIKHHRGETNLSYSDLNKSLNLIINDKPDLLLLDEKISEIYPDLIEKFSFIPKKIILEAGESTKTLKGVYSLLDKIDKLNIYPINHVLLIAGASLQDTAATALSLLKRGTIWSYIPTTLLAQADSCIGSKTSINSKNSKNLYGVFYAPKKIYILPDFLKTLPDTEIISGIGDAMHYLLLDLNSNTTYILELINFLIENIPQKFINDQDKVKKLCKKCHAIKKYFIEIDEFDQDIRKVLNLGHSFGHALESFLDYKIPHGIGVLFGLIFAADISKRINENNLGEQFKDNLKKIKTSIMNLLMKYSPVKPEFVWELLKKDSDKFINILSKDKKNTSKGKYKVILFVNDNASLFECEESTVIEYINHL